MMYFKVCFQYSTTTYCVNIAEAENVEQVEDHYKKYDWFCVVPATVYDMNEAKKKGMPIIHL